MPNDCPPFEHVLMTRSAARPKAFVLETRLLVTRPIDVVFEFFGNAFNLERITPGFLKFEVLTPPPIDMRAGTIIDYRLRVRGFPIRWRSEITAWEPPHRFVDEQRIGPYRYWRHEHLFEPVDGGTLVRDSVTYETPGGSLMNRFLVAPDLRRVFAYRREMMGRLLAD